MANGLLLFRGFLFHLVVCIPNRGGNSNRGDDEALGKTANGDGGAGADCPNKDRGKVEPAVDRGNDDAFTPDPHDSINH